MINFRLSRNLFTTVVLPFRQLSKMQQQNVESKKGQPLKHIIKKLENFAPLAFAEKWDNVGLLIEPYQQKDAIKTIFLTNDLTVNVMEEAVDKNADLIISYHPPIFAPLKRISQNNWKAKIVSMCLAKGIAVYSPHTAWDCAPNGESLNCWLSKAFKLTDNAKPITINPETKTGPGLTWSYPSSLNYKLREVIEDIQNYIGLPVHVAMGVSHSLDSVIQNMACCAGSGASLLKEVSNTDVYITGEMSHHELLDAQHRNITVILCNHSNTERGFLKHFQPKLSNFLESNCEVIVSECDKDPLETFVRKH
ncbi:NIF3-like protein 1 [Episyrphus balteatus]|uniref:NIF3-like protein 1 n=1 Tax=Episyrphus balteatus TaxID=286459 RepID=UPI002484DD4E|nr:NIF3-like protein 1 [Episyrphus balteatus]